MGEMVSYASNGDSCAGYLATPGSGSGPGVIVVQEWRGLVDHIKDVADRFAAAGFVALAPDIYHGATFFNGQRPDVHDEQHSAAAWRRTLDLLKSRL